MVSLFEQAMTGQQTSRKRLPTPFRSHSSGYRAKSFLRGLWWSAKHESIGKLFGDSKSSASFTTATTALTAKGACMSPLSPKWNGSVCCITGLVMLAVQVFAYLNVGLLSSWLIGGGIGLLTIGAAMWSCYVDDKQSATNAEFPPAEVYNRDFEDVPPLNVYEDSPQ